MAFKIRRKEIPEYTTVDHDAKNMIGKNYKFIEALANNLTDEEYHEICHQLYDRKTEFNTCDGECDYVNSLKEKREFTVSSALYRGVFWKTLVALQEKNTQ